MGSIAIDANDPQDTFVNLRPDNSPLIQTSSPLFDRLQALESRDPTKLLPRYNLKQRKTAHQLSHHLYDLTRVLEALKNIRFDTRTSPRFETRWRDFIPEDKLSKVGHPNYASLEAELAQNIGQGLSRPNHWQFHLGRVIEVRKTINNIIQSGSDLALLFGYSLGIRGFALKQCLDLEDITHSFHGLLHQFEIDYICVLLFFLAHFGFTYHSRQLRPLLFTDLPKKIDLWTVIVKVADRLELPHYHLALSRWKAYPTTDVFWA
jgi:hypothetical protein